MWSPLDYPCNDGPKGPDCDPYCLYNIVKDPEERTELSKTEPDMLKKLPPLFCIDHMHCNFNVVEYIDVA